MNVIKIKNFRTPNIILQSKNVKNHRVLFVNIKSSTWNQIFCEKPGSYCSYLLANK